MKIDSQTGEWDVSPSEEKWLDERARELAAEDFNTPPSEDTIADWVAENPDVAARFIAAAIRAEAIIPPLRPALENLRMRWVDDYADYFDGQAVAELMDWEE
jgi:hypothetical protein